MKLLLDCMIEYFKETNENPICKWMNKNSMLPETNVLWNFRGLKIVF